MTEKSVVYLLADAVKWSASLYLLKVVIENAGRERLIRSHSSARCSFELSGNVKT